MVAASAGFLVFSVVAMSCIIIVGCVLMLITFGHPDDRVGAWFPKLVTLAGFYLSFASILALPLDVANSRLGAGLDMTAIWTTIFICIIVMVVIIVPYAFFFYESDTSPDAGQGAGAAWTGQAGTALQYTVIAFIVFGLILGLMYFYEDTATITLSWQKREANLANFSQVYPPTSVQASGGKFICKSQDIAPMSCNNSTGQWTTNVSFLVFCGAIISFIGWFFFMFFCSIGLIALPIDLINEFRTRPVRMTVQEYAKEKIAVGKRASTLLAMAQELQKNKTNLDRAVSRKNRRSDREIQNRLEAEVQRLKHDKRMLEVSYHQKGGNPVVYFAKLNAGLLGLSLSCTWFVQICVFLLPVVKNPFLNVLFMDLSLPGFSLMGDMAFGFYSMYLILCCIKGVFRLGLRIPWCLRVYPMEIGNTMMNAFLFNTWLTLICTIPVVQFCVINFSMYANDTSVRGIFGTQIFYLSFFRMIFYHDAYIFAMFAIMFVTVVAMVADPKDKALEIEKKLKVFEKEDLENNV
ncbi:unnamed protein product (mitochondrion) [Plasmodiophora brassicae]|uniref:LMBR1-like membrane protein n=1 Tax=Plasmodiophora brassicae TaxID=37360 RepID=A0A0G4J5U9_PLABS|nr:hypothetical protein PBRA_002593 [Plasmodiophora brassicae]SPQ94755.1 unnamed protein product [Plasmodiophora brassicae]